MQLAQAIEKFINILKNDYPYELVKELMVKFDKIKISFALKKYSEVESEGGLFVEVFRRMFEYKMSLKYIPIGFQLMSFNENQMQIYQSSIKLLDYEKKIIVYLLKIIYNIRNTRSNVHLNSVNANAMDANLVYHICCWSISELARNSNLTDEEKNTIIFSNNEKHLDLVFKVDGNKRVLNVSLTLKEKILVLLYSESQKVLLKNLIQWLECSNLTFFKKTVKELHKARYIEADQKGCTILPNGIIMAEKIILKNENVD